MKYLLSSLFVVFFLLVFPSISFAACNIDIVKFDEGSRNLEVCIGGFSSPTQLRSTTVQFNCADNSNLSNQGCRGTGGEFWHGLEPVDISLSGTENTKIAQAGDGTYYTCPIITSINRAVGKANLSVSGANGCASAEVTTQPGNWNPLLEGNIFGQAAQALIPASAPPAISVGSVTCVASDGTQGINTALGCISYDATGGGFIRSLLGIIIGLGGGVALLLILYGIFIVTTSAGIPEKLKEGKELITSAIAGLLFIIMAIFLMNLIGIKILALPGLE